METIIYLIIALLASNYVEERREHDDSKFWEILSGLSLGAIIVIVGKIIIMTMIVILKLLRWIL